MWNSTSLHRLSPERDFDLHSHLRKAAVSQRKRLLRTYGFPKFYSTKPRSQVTRLLSTSSLLPVHPKELVYPFLPVGPDGENQGRREKGEESSW